MFTGNILKRIVYGPTNSILSNSRTRLSFIAINSIYTSSSTTTTTATESALFKTNKTLPACLFQQTRNVKTVKRRKRYPFHWRQDKYRTYFDENLTAENEQKFQEFLKQKFSLDSSPLKNEPWSYNETWKPGMKRTGLLGRKLGTYVQWTKDGRRITTSLVQISDNHVIKYHTPEEFQNLARPMDRTRFTDIARIIVGADSTDPRLFTAEYNGLFSDSSVMTKRRLTRFMISPQAKLEPGTPLYASHFRPGMLVDVHGITIEHGEAGVRDRFHLKLGQASHGTTKSHNRIGSIGRGRKECGPLKGRRMPGHLGGEHRNLKNLKVWRLNTKYNLLWLMGPAIPGDTGAYINIMDSSSEKNQEFLLSHPPPFPTCFSEENSKLEEDLYDEALHVMDQPSLMFEETEEERRQMLLATKSGKAKTAQKRR